MSTHLRVLVLIVLATSAWACSPAAVASLLPPAAAGPLVTITTRGGECPEGACGSQHVIDRDGRFRQTAPESVDVGRVPPETLVVLEAAIASTDFAVIRARPFTGECPVNFDGQEIIYEFAAPGRIERIATCETEIDPDHPLFVAVRETLSAAGAV